MLLEIQNHTKKPLRVWVQCVYECERYLPAGITLHVDAELAREIISIEEADEDGAR